MKNKTIGIFAITVLRIFIGWHILYEGVSKIIIPNWSSRGFLSESKWILSDFTNWIIGHEGVLNIVDFLNVWGLVAIGTGLILGLFTGISSISGALLLLVYYLCNPPLIGLEYSIPLEGNNLIVSKTLIEAAALFVLAVSPYRSSVGLDLLFEKYKNRKK
jgi:thiosulfate dehydrogenase [quinone] large subunit